MENIIVKGLFTLLTKKSRETTPNVNFKVKLEKGLNADVTINYKEKNVITWINNISVSNGFINSVKEIDKHEFEKLHNQYKEKVLEIHRLPLLASKNVLSLIKYYLRHSDISENLLSNKNIQWGTKKNDLYDLPTSIKIDLNFDSTTPLNHNSISLVQSALDSKISPLIALRHLHRAKEENISHHKWIDATIAAELAIKEVLIIHNPNLEILLMEIPSPPLDKLYGSILEEYLGERSPYLNKIKKGVEIRNKLVHKPNGYKIDTQKANEYVNIIEAAIFHLLYLIYPNHNLVENGFYQTKNMAKPL
jgi:hypothetical protein